DRAGPEMDKIASEKAHCPCCSSYSDSDVKVLHGRLRNAYFTSGFSFGLAVAFFSAARAKRHAVGGLDCGDRSRELQPGPTAKAQVIRRRRFRHGSGSASSARRDR